MDALAKRISYLALELSFFLTLVSHVIFGISAVVVAMALCVFCLKGWKCRVLELVKIIFPALLLGSFFYIPALLSMPFGVYGRVIAMQQPSFNLLDIGYFLSGIKHKYPNPMMAGELSPLVLPIFTLLLILNVLGRKRRRVATDLVWVKTFVTVTIVLIVYAILTGVPDYVYYASIFLPLTCGVLLGCVTGRSMKVLLLCTVIATAFIVWPISSLSTVVTKRDVESFFAYDVVQRLLSNQSKTEIADHRFGIPSDSVAVWFSYAYPRIPQTRHYYSIGVLNLYWIGWFEDVVWNHSSENYETSHMETNFLLDWYGVKWFIVYPPYNSMKYSSRLLFYQEIAKGGNGCHGFIYRNASPIVSAVNVANLLVIGEQYELSIHSLAYSCYDSQHVIPIRGGEYVDEYSLEELKKFDTILLYGYKCHDADRAWGLLQEYVAAGGGLIIETGLQYVSPDWNTPYIPPPCPVNKTIWTNFGKDWHFTQTSTPVSASVNFSAFSPAISGDDPWYFSSSLNESVRPWAQPVLWNYGRPMIVMGNYGAGRVIWSGMNLPWHIKAYKSCEESAFLAKIIDWASRASERRAFRTNYEAERVNPERIVVMVRNASAGVLFRECHFENWHAYLVSAEGKDELKIYRAGPDFMYVHLPKDSTYPIEIVFEYQRSLTEWGSCVVTVMTLLVLVAYAFGVIDPEDLLKAFLKLKRE